MEPGKPPPDFALVRAVEILAQIAERQRAAVLPPPVGVPIVLFNEHVMFVIGKTRRDAVVGVLGAGSAFPTRGWETYAMHEGGSRLLLAACYRDGLLIAVDYAVAPPQRVPELRARAFGEFRFVPGPIAIGSDLIRLDARFAATAAQPDARTYSHTFEARFPGGVAFVQGTGGRVQRLVLYAVEAQSNASSGATGSQA